MPSFNDVVAGSSADSSCVQQIIDALKGTAGQGVPISITAVNDAANFALDVQNDDAVNSRSFRVQNAAGGTLIQADVNGLTLNQVAVSSGTLTGSTIIAGTLTGSTMSMLAASSNVVRLPHVKLTHTSTQSVSSGGAFSAVTFDTEVDDTDGLHSTASNPTRLTPSRPGIWSVGGAVTWAGNSSGYRDLAVRIGGTSFALLNRQQPSSANILTQSVSGDLVLSTAQYIELVMAQDGGGSSLSISSNLGYSPLFWMTYRGST